MHQGASSHAEQALELDIIEVRNGIMIYLGKDAKSWTFHLGCMHQLQGSESHS